ncbi:hypothetical protein KC19_12G006200 [Ceratodon purpureus]|uniref:Uncharacterized protein n=1 Tax=Ceratodon purpureus TaxID=3225 RepID=A0A8T0G7Y2_CERPU|nr:hypothetical protein KC19_12G006200 [Ceratodon purpureus]
MMVAGTDTLWWIWRHAFAQVIHGWMLPSNLSYRSNLLITVKSESATWVCLSWQ